MNAVFARAMAAVFGGYAFTYAFTACLARLLPLERIDALLVASLPMFVVYTLAVLWAFAARDVWRAWLGLPLAIPLALIGFWPQLLERLG
ncbi:iron transporter [Aquipseudomonas alcaligenes]|uniref:Iron transporter n=1 Tax=Aquipseudomonas alcaligenes TaxID=43263 RepID=A0AB73I2Z2_AQUAC|nr:iron transporter [Pseudomonas alcaligenes]MDH0144582.1 iron transporter [Pseudomonas alcaligenes]